MSLLLATILYSAKMLDFIGVALRDASDFLTKSATSSQVIPPR